MSAHYGPCETWEPIVCVSWPAGSGAITGHALESATLALWSASGRVFGLCERVIRPCRRDCAGELGGWYQWTPGEASWPAPALIRGNWYNIACRACSGSCSCVGLEEALLPSPVYDVVQVKLNGETLSATGVYRVDDGIKLTRIDGGLWPTCQDMAASDDQSDTWSVTVRVGIEVPTLGRQAVGELAREIASACLGTECRLPPGVQQLVRQGVTIDFGDANMNDISERLYFCGMFINSVNPQRLQEAQPEVFFIDGDPWRETGTA